MKISSFIFICLITTIQLKISAQNFERTILTYEDIRKINGVFSDSLEREKIYAIQDSMYQDYLKQKDNLNQSQILLSIPNWRSMMGPVENQLTETCSTSCWRHAATGVTEGQLNILYGTNMHINLNEDEILTCGLNWPSNALAYINSNKVSSEVGISPNLEGIKWGISGQTSISGITAIKDALENGPVTAVFDIYSDFIDFFNNPNNDLNVYRHQSGSYQATHAVVIVSYDEGQQYWLCKNSFGTGWADGGYFKIGFANCGIETKENRVVTVDYSCLGKVIPSIFNTINSAFNYNFTTNEKAVVNGTTTLNGNVTVSSGKTLSLLTGSNINFNNYYIDVAGGIFNLPNEWDVFLKIGSKYYGLFSNIESALSAATSGKTVEVWGSQSISNNITIGSGITLSVKPNVTLTFGSSKRIYVIGTLAANGATFQGNGTAGSWYALYFYANSSGSFQSCTIKDAQAGIYCNTVTNLTVSNSTIRNNSLYGFSLISSSPTISNCTIENNGTGINSSGSRPAITGCTVQNNTNYGVTASNIDQYYPHLFWYDNDFSGNGYAILLNNASPYLHNNVISDNNHGISITSSYTNFAYPDSNWRGYNAITCNAATPNFRAQNYSSIYAGYGPPNGQDAGGYNSIFGSELPDMEAYDHSTIYACNNYWGSPYPAINADGTSTILAWYPLSSDPNPGSCSFNKSSSLAKSSATNDNQDISDKFLQAMDSGFEDNYSNAKELLKTIIEDKFNSKYTPLALLEYYNLDIKDKELNRENAYDYSNDVLLSVYNRETGDPLRPFAARLLAREASLNGKTEEMIFYNTEIIENYPNSSNEISALYDLVNYYYETEQNDLSTKYLKRMEEAYPKNDLTLFARVNLGLSSFDLEKNESLTANEQIPDEYILEDNYPNPFNPSTTIRFQIPKAGLVTLKVYDILGNEVATLVDEFREAGKYEVSFDAGNLSAGRQSLSSGVYIYKLQAGSFVSTKKMLLLK